MNYLEFKRQLMVDPYDRGLDFQEAVRTNPDCAAAAAASDSFESMLRAAVDVPVPEDIAELAIAQRKQPLPAGQALPTGRKSVFGWLPAMAAGLAMGVGLTTAVFLFNGAAGEQNLEQHLASHWSKDGEITLRLAAQNPMQENDIRRVLASLNLAPTGVLVRDIAYARNCGTPNGDVMHMVLDTGAGLITVIYMPNTDVEHDEHLEVGDQNVVFARMEHGSVALIGEAEEDLTSSISVIRSNLKERIDI